MFGKAALLGVCALAGGLAANATSAGVADLVEYEQSQAGNSNEAPMLVPSGQNSNLPDLGKISEPSLAYALPVSYGLSDLGTTQAVPVPLAKPDRRVQGPEKLPKAVLRAKQKIARVQAEKARPQTAKMVSMAELMRPIIGSYR